MRRVQSRRLRGANVQNGRNQRAFWPDLSRFVSQLADWQTRNGQIFLESEPNSIEDSVGRPENCRRAAGQRARRLHEDAGLFVGRTGAHRFLVERDG